MRIKKFNEDFDGMMDFFPDEKMTFDKAFEKFIKGQKAVSTDYGITRFENGYSIHNHGGGCSGEDCNEQWIEDPKGKNIGKEEW